MRAVLIIHLVLAFSFASYGQSIFNIFQSNIRRADELYQEKAYSSSLNLYLEAVNTSNHDALLDLKIARCLKSLNRLSEAESWFELASQNPKVFNPQDYLDYAEAMMSNGKYDRASKYFDAYTKKYGKNNFILKKTSSTNNLPALLEDSSCYQVKKLPFNSNESDFNPVLYNNGLLFLSSRKRVEMIRNIDAGTNESFYQYYYAGSAEDTNSVPFATNMIHAKYHLGPITFLNDRNKIVFTCNASSESFIADDGMKRLMLYSAEKDSSGKYGKNITALPFNNKNYSVGHATYDESQSILYFVSDMPGGYGGTDIYSSKWDNGRWTVPVNLGPNINTYGNELFPVIYKSKILIFSSTGHPGLGGLDVFYTVIENSDLHYPIQNIGYPVNSKADDFSLVISEDATGGYFSSNREGNDDIYRFSLNTVIFHGAVVDKLGEKKMSKVSVKVLEKDQKVFEQVTDDHGNFNLSLKPGRTYIVVAFKEGYKESKTTINTPATNSNKVFIDKNILLERRNKSFIKGIIKDSSGTPIPDCNVRIMNSYGVDSKVTSNKEGLIKCEVDSDVENVFIAEKDRLWGTYTLEPESRAKGSLVLNVEIEVNFVRTYDINGFLKSEKSGLPLEGFEVIVMNHVTGEKDIICTGNDGRFNFKAVSSITYDIIIKFGKRKTHLKSFAPKQDYNFEIFWAEN